MCYKLFSNNKGRSLQAPNQVLFYQELQKNRLNYDFCLLVELAELAGRDPAPGFEDAVEIG